MGIQDIPAILKKMGIDIHIDDTACDIVITSDRCVEGLKIHLEASGGDDEPIEIGYTTSVVVT